MCTALYLLLPMTEGAVAAVSVSAPVGAARMSGTADAAARKELSAGELLRASAENPAAALQLNRARRAPALRRLPAAGPCTSCMIALVADCRKLAWRKRCDMVTRSRWQSQGEERICVHAYRVASRS